MVVHSLPWVWRATSPVAVRRRGPWAVRRFADQARLSDECLHVGQCRFPLDANQRAILRYRGPSGTHEAYSAAAVIQSEMRLREGGGQAPVIDDPSVFKDCYVLFGFSAPGLMDLRPTPVSRVFPGVEIHATVLDNLLSGDFLRDVPSPLVVLAVLVLAVLGALSVVHSKKARHSVLAFGAFLPAPAVFGIAAYEAGFWLPVVVQELAVAVAMVGALGLNYVTEGRQKAFYRHAFKHYLSPVVIDRLLDEPSRLKLGGERRELSIFFSDLQGFSSISERLDPQDLTTLLNDYLSDMTDIILEEEGTVDKYEGDAIIAFWNAPLAQPDHALRACRAALRCQQKLRERGQEFLQRAGVRSGCASASIPARSWSAIWDRAIVSITRCWVMRPIWLRGWKEPTRRLAPTSWWRNRPGSRPTVS